MVVLSEGVPSLLLFVQFGTLGDKLPSQRTGMAAY